MLPPGFVPSSRAFETSPDLDPELLALVEKPSRYLGGEVNQIKKDLGTVESRVALCYPDLYEIGMSHIGLKILYAQLNADPRVACERVYAVAPDMERELRARNLRLRTLENRVPLCDLDVIGFTLQYELSYGSLLQVLDLGGIAFRAADRDRNAPLVIAGGPCAFNPEPLAPFLDAVCLGDGEITLPLVVETHRAWKRSSRSREHLLLALAELPGVYVPSLYDVEYDDLGRVAAIEPRDGAPRRVKKAILPDIDSAPYPTATPVPFMPIVHDRVGVEIQRGCMRGCRFCQAGYVYRPDRQRSPETIKQLVRDALKSTGWEEYSLLSLSAGDYACMEPLLVGLMDEHEGKRSAISMPSMRLETLTPGIMEQVGRVRKTSFTVAPEAASDRLRAVINKVIDEDVLIDMVGEVFRRGFPALKFYFMLGIPTEQQEDLQAMADLGARCLARAKKFRRDAQITISVSTFVPKSHTPFQWAKQITIDQIREKQAFLREELKRRKLGFRYHHDRSTVMEGVFSRGDRRTADLLVAAYEEGARLDGWQEHHDEAAWGRAFARTGLDPAFYNQRRRDADEVLPWSHIDVGIKPEWLWADWMDALEAGFVPDCSTEPCYDCGVCDHDVIHNRVYDAADGTQRHRARKPFLGNRRDGDPQFVAMPRPPRKKANGAVDAVPPQGMAPGSAGARYAREQQGPLVVRDPTVPPTPPSPLPPPEARTKVLVRYGKRGSLVHLGHLEVMNTFRRALRRIDAPVLWSQGFHPQQKLSFSAPLPTSMGSESEFVEIELGGPVDVEAFGAALSAAMPADLPVIEWRSVPPRTKSLQTRIAAWTYRVVPPDGEKTEALASSRTIPETVATDKGEVALRAVISDIAPREDGAIDLTLRAEGAGARVRDVLRGVFGERAAQSRDGWCTVRVAARWADEAEGVIATG